MGQRAGTVGTVRGERERERERGTICITKRGEGAGGRGGHQRRDQGADSGHRALVTSHQWSARARGAQGSGQWTPVRHMSRQGPVLVNGDTSGVRGALNGQGMVSTCHQTPGIGQSALCTGQCAAPIGHKISQICGNSVQIVTKPRARPCLATLGGRGGDELS